MLESRSLGPIGPSPEGLRPRQGSPNGPHAHRCCPAARPCRVRLHPRTGGQPNGAAPTAW